MKGEEEHVKKAVSKVAEDYDEKVLQNVMDTTLNIVQKGISPKDAMGVSDEQSEAIYAQAYRLYNTGKYQEAIHLFRVLIFLLPNEYKYSLGLAACFHMLKEYDNAIRAYMVAGLLDGNSPIPHFHASDCYIQMQDPASAILMLDMAINKAANKPEFQILKDRALLMMSSLKKEME